MAAVRFTGTYAELRERLSSVGAAEGWSELNENQKQFRATDGGILNWYPSTGTITFQGPRDAKSKLESAVARCPSRLPIIRQTSDVYSLKRSKFPAKRGFWARLSPNRNLSSVWWGQWARN